MKVTELVKILRCIENQEAEVIMSSDAKGNSFHQVDGVDIANPSLYIIFPEHEIRKV